MENKVLIKLIIPELDISYDIFIPVNELIWKIKKLIMHSVFNLENFNVDKNAEFVLINKDNCKIYNNNEIVINTDIRNGTELFLISKI